MLDRATNEFSIKSFSGSMYGIGIDTSGRLVINGIKSPNGYTTRSFPQLISIHPDFQTAATWTMNLLSSGTDDIVADSGQTIGSVTTQTVSVPSPAYTNLTVTYVAGISYTSDVNYLIGDQLISAPKSTTTQITPNLPCSISGSTSITFSIGNYISSAPTWVTINSASGALTITAPEVASDTEYNFYINSLISGYSSTVQKLIKLTITNTNSNTNTISGSSNSKTKSTTAQFLSTVIISVAVAIIVIITFSSLIGKSSWSIIWLFINQLQLLFLLLITGAFIPGDVEAVILGPDFAFNIYQYIPFKNINLYSSGFKKFDFVMTKSELETLGYNYSTTLANTKSLLTSTILIVIYSF